MTTIKKVALVAAVILCVLIPAGAISAGAATADVVGDKAALDPDPPSPVTPSQQKILDQKWQAAAALLSRTKSTATVGASNAVMSLASSAASSTSASLTEDQNPQKKSYYCGPATVNEALGQMGHWHTQAFYAGPDQLNTEATHQTSWGAANSGPVPIVMDKHQSRVNYVGQPVSPSPTSTEIDFYKLGLVVNISSLRAPLIGDAYEIPYGPRLNGHPLERTIFHWFDIYGYTSSGANTTYEDSVYKAETVSWHELVTAPHATIPSSKIVKIVGGRGYVW